MAYVYILLGLLNEHANINWYIVIFIIGKILTLY